MVLLLGAMQMSRSIVVTILCVWAAVVVSILCLWAAALSIATIWPITVAESGISRVERELFML